MDMVERDRIIDAFGGAYAPVLELVSGMSRVELAFVPPLEDAWSVNEHLVHLLDADCNMVYRIRGGIAGPGLHVPLWGEEAWKARNNYARSDGKACLALAVSLRAFMADSLRTLDAATWDAAHIVHPTRGRLDLPALLSTCVEHAAFHLPYVKRNLDLFHGRPAQG